MTDVVRRATQPQLDRKRVAAVRDADTDGRVGAHHGRADDGLGQRVAEAGLHGARRRWRDRARLGRLAVGEPGTLQHERLAARAHRRCGVPDGRVSEDAGEQRHARRNGRSAPAQALDVDVGQPPPGSRPVRDSAPARPPSRTPARAPAPRSGRAVPSVAPIPGFSPSEQPANAVTAMRGAQRTAAACRHRRVSP